MAEAKLDEKDRGSLGIHRMRNREATTATRQLLTDEQGGPRLLSDRDKLKGRQALEVDP